MVNEATSSRKSALSGRLLTWRCGNNRVAPACWPTRRRPLRTGAALETDPLPGFGGQHAGAVPPGGGSAPAGFRQVRWPSLAGAPARCWRTWLVAWSSDLDRRGLVGSRPRSMRASLSHPAQGAAEVGSDARVRTSRQHRRGSRMLERRSCELRQSTRVSGRIAHGEIAGRRDHRPPGPPAATYLAAADAAARCRVTAREHPVALRACSDPAGASQRVFEAQHLGEPVVVVVVVLDAEPASCAAAAIRRSLSDILCCRALRADKATSAGRRCLHRGADRHGAQLCEVGLAGEEPGRGRERRRAARARSDGRRRAGLGASPPSICRGRRAGRRVPTPSAAPVGPDQPRA